MSQRMLVPYRGFAVMFVIFFGVMLSGCIHVDCKDCCGTGGKEACFSHNPPTTTEMSTFNCNSGDICDAGGTCPRGQTCKTTSTGTPGNPGVCSCGCKPSS